MRPSRLSSRAMRRADPSSRYSCTHRRHSHAHVPPSHAARDGRPHQKELAISCSPYVAGLQLQFAAAALHVLGGIVAYFGCKPIYDEQTCRTFAIETSMKSSAFGFLLAKLHFDAFLVRVPAAVSVVWMALVGSSLAVAFRALPVKEE